MPTEAEREDERLFEIIFQNGLYREWVRFYRANDHRMPPGPGSKIIKMSIVLKQEFLDSKEIKYG